MTTDTRVLSGRYRVDDLIGRGGMASVYRGFDEKLGRSVAIKILKPDLAADAAFRTRFRLEAQAASRMANPAIVRVYDAGEDHETNPDGSTCPVPFIVMELVQGSLLKDVITVGPVSTADAVRYTDGILEALEYSHRAGVVHRDIKPGNVMVTDRGQVKVMDFGIARAVSDSSSTVADTTAILGTAAYFSPEQAKGESVDARADLYSTGIVLFELLTGKQPFRGESPVAVAYQHVSETPARPSDINPEVSRALDAVVLRALAKDPYQRYQPAAQFREAVDAATDGKVPSKREVGALTSELYGPNPRAAAETARSLRQLSTDNTMTRTQSGPPVAWIWTGVAGIAAVIVALFFWLITIQPAEAPALSPTVPDVTGMTWEEASAELEEIELLATRTEQIDAEVEAGNVISTIPEAGVIMNAGENVQVYVSTGAQVAVAPVVIGLTELEARAALTGVGLVVGEIRSRNAPGLAAGIVLESSLAEGDEAVVGTTVTLTVATGRVTINNYVGFTLDAAIKDLESADIGLSVNTVPDPSCKAEASKNVTTQSIPPGDAPVGATIDLRFCSGE